MRDYDIAVPGDARVTEKEKEKIKKKKSGPELMERTRETVEC